MLPVRYEASLHSIDVEGSGLLGCAVGDIIYSGVLKENSDFIFMC
jgi:hypothetical protein